MKMHGQTIEDFSIGLGVMLYMRLDSVHKNVNIKTSDGKTIQSHSILLAAVSPKFKAVFEENEFGVYHLNTPQVSGYTWKMMLDFLYTGQIHLPKDTQAFDALVSACQGLEFTPLLPYLNLHNDEDTDNVSEASSFSRGGRAVVSRANGSPKGGKTRGDSSDDERYECDICNKSYASPHALYAHKGHHRRPGYTPTKPKPAVNLTGEFECEYCQQTFASKGSLASHKGRMHPQNFNTRGKANSKLTCKLCNKTFLSSGGLGMHMKSHENDSDASDKENSSQDEESSEEEDEEEDDFECKICHRKFQTSKSLQVHKGHHNRENYNITQSSNEEPDPGSPSKESNLSESQTEYVCTECNATLPTRKALSSHLAYHSRPGALCPVCDQKCYSKQHFVSHMKSKHKDYNYDIKKIKFKPKTVNHGPPTTSQQKGKVSKNVKTQLAAQKERIKKIMGKIGGTSKGNMKCPICGDGFKKPGPLAAHLRFSHARKNWRTIAENKKMDMTLLPPGWKDFMTTTCIVCSRKTPSLTKMVQHYQLAHKDTHPYKCSQCNGSFVNYKGLSCHLFVHVPEWKPCICQHCDYTCVKMESLTTHYEKHHPGFKTPKAVDIDEESDTGVAMDGMESD